MAVSSIPGERARGRARRGLLLLTGAALLAYGAVIPARPATAAPRGAVLACGATITRDTVLLRDLTGCPSNGVLIGADHVRLDLNGHTIAGDGALVPDCPQGTPCDRGVDAQGHRGLTVEHGSVTGFGVGVWAEGGDEVRFRRLSVSDNAFLGILLIGSSRSELTRNHVVRNGVGNDGGGVAVVDTHRSTVSRNTVSGNGSQGIQVVGGSDDNLVAQNRAFGNLDAGIGIEGDRNRVAHNHVFRNGDDVIVVGNHNLVRRNRVSDAVGCADDGCGFGISVERGTANVISQNSVTRARTGIRVDAFDGASTGTVIERNVVRASSVDGIAVDLEHAGPVADTLISRDVVTGSGDDGIDVESASTTLTRNVTVYNGDLGIEAVPGVDGRRNHASGNGDPAQCLGIVCSG